MDMGTQGSGRKRLPNRERLTAEDDALNLIAREAEARLAAKRAARAEAREIRMKELERQQKEIYQVQKKYYGLDTKWGDIEQWMEDSERYSRRSRRNTSASDEDERLSVGSRGSLRAQPDVEYGGPYAWTNGYDGDYCGSQSLSRRSGRNSSYSGDSRFSTLSSSREEKLGLFGSDLGFPNSGLASKPLSSQNGTRASVMDASSYYGTWRGSACGSRAPSEYSSHLNSSSRASSRASSARASPVVEERPDKDFAEKGSRNMPSLSAATLASLGGTSSRRGSGDTSISIDTEASIREIKELNELKDQIQDVEGKYMQGLKEMKDSLAEVEEKYKRAMVSNAQLDNEKTNFMYQVDTLKDMLLELEEQLAETQRQYEEKTKEFEREKHAHSILQFQFAEVKEALRQREDMLEKHGIILNSEIATNGETSDTLNNVGYQGPTKMTKEEINALKSAGEGTLGKAKEVEVKDEMVENVGKGGILPDTEQEQHKEDTVEDREVLRPGENAEDQKPAEDSVPCPGPLADAECEQQVQSQVHNNASSLENPEQLESPKVTDKPDDRTRNSLEQSNCLGNLESKGTGLTHGQGGCDALDSQNQSENSVGSQEAEKQEDLKMDLKEASSEPCPHSVLGQIPEVDKVSCPDAGGAGENITESVAEAGESVLGEEVDMVASRPLEHINSTVSQDGRCGDTEIRDEKPAQAEIQASPGAPVAQSVPQDAVGPGSVDAGNASLDTEEPNQEKNSQQAEALDSPQKKTKNRKKKNKKKKSPASMEALKDDRKEVDSQNAEAGDVEEEEQGRPIDRIQVAEPQDGEIENPTQKILAGSNEHPKAEMNGKQSEKVAEDAKTQAERAEFEDKVPQWPGTSVGDEDMEAHVTKHPTDGPTEPECGEWDSSSQLEKKSSPKDVSDAAQKGRPEEQVPVSHPGQTAEEASDSGIPENGGLSEELGDFSSEREGQARGTDEKGRGKEDCTMS